MSPRHTDIICNSHITVLSSANFQALVASIFFKFTGIDDIEDLLLLIFGQALQNDIIIIWFFDSNYVDYFIPVRDFER